MLLAQIKLKRDLKLFVCTLICCGTVALFIGEEIYNNGILLWNITYYFQYYAIPSQVKIGAKKIIFLWTPIHGSYKDWSWGIGSEPIIDDCNNPKIDGKCLITTHPDLLEEANVVLFSIRDIKQVCSYV